MEIWIVTAILIATLYFLISEKIPIDLTAIGIMVILTATGILAPVEAVSGFANPAVITVGAMFLISRAMIRTGTVEYIGQKVLDWAKGRPAIAMLLVLLIVAVASAFINNTPIVVLFIPVVMSMGCRFGLSPSKYLIPISYASILAGTCTLIGTSTNIIVSDLAAHYGYRAFGMFELAVVGVPIAIVGLAMIIAMGPRLMPDLLNPSCEMDSAQRRYLAELTVPKGSRLVGLNPCDGLPSRYSGIEILELIRYSHIFHPCRDTVTIAPNDLLLVKGSPNSLMAMLNDKVSALPTSENGRPIGDPSGTFVAELIHRQGGLVGNGSHSEQDGICPLGPVFPE